MITPPPSTTTTEAPTYPSSGYAWYVVVLLMLCYTLSFVDRQIMGFLVGPIRRDLSISDTEVGLLGGPAFALFYTFVGLPMGWLADRFSRRAIIANGVAAWSVMTAVCALPRSFAGLFVARIGVGVGEATLGPSAFSLLSDYFPRDKLGTALAVYSMGIMIGSGTASIVGGLIVQAVATMPAVQAPIVGEMAPWRFTFLVVGLPGLVVALLLLTVREPTRKGILRAADGSAAKLPVAELIRQVRSRLGSVVAVSVGLGCSALTTYALTFWGPPFFARVHGWQPRQTGLALGVVTIVFGCLGLFTGSRLCGRWLARGVHEAPLKIGVIGNLGVGVAMVAAMLAPSAPLAVAFLAPVVFFQGFPIGSTYASLQWIFPNQLRGVVSALLLFVINLIGLTLGPLLPGFFNDSVFRDEKMVGYSIALAVGLATAIGAAVFRSGYAAYRRDYGLMHGPPS